MDLASAIAVSFLHFLFNHVFHSFKNEIFNRFIKWPLIQHKLSAFDPLLTSIILSQIILVKALEVPPCIYCFILQKASFHVNSSSNSMMVTIRMNFPVKLAFYTTLLVAQKTNPHIVSSLWAVFAFSCHSFQIFYIGRRSVYVKERNIFDSFKCYSVTTRKLHEKFVNFLHFMIVV